MADERWKLLEGKYEIKSQEDWDKVPDMAKELYLKDKAFFDELHETGYKKEAEAYKDLLYGVVKGRERYDYNFEHAAEHADEEWNWAHNEEVMDQAKSDFASNKKLQKKFGCWENLFFDRTLPEMISMIEGVVNGLAIDILPYLKFWPWGVDIKGSDKYKEFVINYEDWMNWYDKILYASIQPFKYWENNIYTLDQNAEYYTNFYQRVGRFFSETTESERNPYNIVFSFLEPARRPVIIRSLWYRSFYYHSFILRYDLHDALNEFIGFDPREDYKGNVSIGGLAVVGPCSEDAAKCYAEINNTIKTWETRKVNLTTHTYVYMENFFPVAYGLQDWNKKLHFGEQKEKWDMFYSGLSGEKLLHYSWTEYPRYLLGSKSSPIDKILKYLN